MYWLFIVFMVSDYWTCLKVGTYSNQAIFVVYLWVFRKFKESKSQNFKVLTMKVLYDYEFSMSVQRSKLRVRPAPSAHISVDGRTFF